MEARLAYLALTKWNFGKKNMQGDRRGGSYIDSAGRGYGENTGGFGVASGECHLVRESVA